MYRLYFGLGPNPEKVLMALEELGASYELELVDTLRGQQHTAAYRAVNPNAKVPALRDGETVVFDSSAILLYLAEKHGKLLGPSSERGALLSWLMFVGAGVGPYSGQAVHFARFAPAPQDYAVRRYRREVERHYRVLDERLAIREWLVGDGLTIADIGAWGWATRGDFVLGREGALMDFPHVHAWLQRVSALPSAIKAKAVSAAQPIKREFDEEARRAFFPQNYDA
ncbi:MAG: glutathione S-transferase family protein [Hyphomonadaceae bacterium]|nr:glutathione S-transferase family protein [Hyphomonadaceae bacterium]